MAGYLLSNPLSIYYFVEMNLISLIFRGWHCFNAEGIILAFVERFREKNIWYKTR